MPTSRLGSGGEPGSCAGAARGSGCAHVSAQAPAHGAVVVAASDGAGPAAWALAFDVYRDPDLRPIHRRRHRARARRRRPRGGRAARLKELAELRVSIAHAGSAAGGAPAARARSRTELGAAMVVAVTLDGTRPVARVLRSARPRSSASSSRPPSNAADGARTFRWPGATTTLHGFLLSDCAAPTPVAPPGAVRPRLATPSPAPLAPKVESSAAPPAPAEPSPFYKSPWFWGSAGGAAADRAQRVPHLAGDLVHERRPPLGQGRSVSVRRACARGLGAALLLAGLLP